MELTSYYANMCVILTLLTVCCSVPLKEETKVGCVKCHSIEKKRINVHLVPHSHDDVGWLKTVEQYYYGLHNEVQQASVMNIIDSVIDALAANPDRRFIQVETAFFWQWWITQKNQKRRDQFKSLVDNGQLEMVNGAWSMNDEACSNYQSTIDQFTWGLRALNDTIGECAIPRVGWQIDPFGHSREHASLLSQMGYDGVFFARLHDQDLEARKLRKSLNLVWQGSANLEKSIIFTGIFPTGSYSPPDSQCYDVLCSDRIIDDPKNDNYNLDQQISYLKDQLKEWEHYYPTNSVLVTMGDDFHFQKAEINYSNMDKLINAMRNDKDYNVFYSTPSCFIKAVYDSNPVLELYTEDFFPYRQDPDMFWTGYFTSRPNSKRFERIGHNVLQVGKQLYALATLSSGKVYDKHLRKLREVMGIMQHHDAITGTEKQHVADDYVRLLTSAIQNAEEPMGKILNGLTKMEDKNILEDLSSCLLANISICSVSQSSEKFLVVVYNPLAWTTTHFVRLPVDEGSYSVNGPDGLQDYDVVPTYISVFGPLKPKERPSNLELVFSAKDVPPLGLKVYHISKDSISTKTEEISSINEDSPFAINPKTNLLQSVTLNGITLNITQNFLFYIPSNSWPSSGAYLFRPQDVRPKELIKVAKIREFKGKIVHEFHQKWETKEMDLAQSIRWYKQEGYLEFDWTVGHLNKNKNPKEVITRFKIGSFNNKGIFYTDSNGREMITRVRNKHPSYEEDAIDEFVSSNYYPVTSRIVLRDYNKNIEVALLNDRPQGGSSLTDGELELMIHRRLLQDDEKGVGENLDEKEFGKGVFARGKHYLVFGKAKEVNEDGKSTAVQSRILAQKKLLEPWIGVSKTDHTFISLSKILNLSFTALKRSLPDNVNIITLEPWRKNSLLVRLEHILEKNDDEKLAKSVEVDLSKIFERLNISAITEMTLAANQKLEDYQAKGSYQWNFGTKNKNKVEVELENFDNKISLSPMQIRTFIVEYNVAFKIDDYPDEFDIDGGSLETLTEINSGISSSYASVFSLLEILIVFTIFGVININGCL